MGGCSRGMQQSLNLNSLYFEIVHGCPRLLVLLSFGPCNMVQQFIS